MPARGPSSVTFGFGFSAYESATDVSSEPTEYVMHGRRITEPVLKVPPDGTLGRLALLEHDIQDRAAQNRKAGWLAALALASTLGAASYLGSRFFTQEAHIRRMNEQLRENQDRTTELKLEKRLLERRIVTLETKIEALEEDHENLRR